MRTILGIILAALLLFGCTSETQDDSAIDEINETEEQQEVEQSEEVEENDDNDSVPGILEVPDKEDAIEQKEGNPAKSQDDCSSLSPNCESCVAQEGCSWCKTTNGCYYDGIVPTISSCDPGDWAEEEVQCQGPKGGSSCDEQTNCADCLSGSGCKWCIQGSVCKDANANADCFGGWLAESFQCNYASR